MPAQGSPVTLRIVLPQPSREERPVGGDLADQRLHVAQRHVVDLDVLAGRDVALVERGVLLDHAAEGLHLLRGDAAEGELDADHLHVGLALPVDALFEAEADELLFGQLAGEELLGFVVEVVELALDDRDDVPGDVLVRLRVLERAGAALAALLLVLVYDYLHAKENSKT